MNASWLPRLSREGRPAATPQPLPGAWWTWLAAGIVLALTVAAITGIISYEHGLDVAHATGNTGLVADLFPLVPDLLIAMSSLVLVVASAMGFGYPGAAIAALVVGIGWTVAQNVAAGLRISPGDAVLSGGVPVAFVLTVELLLWLVRKVRRTRATAGAGQREAAQPVTTAAALRLLLDSASQRDLAFVLGVDRNRVLAWDRRLDGADGEADGPVPAASMNGHAREGAGDL